MCASSFQSPSNYKYHGIVIVRFKFNEVHLYMQPYATRNTVKELHIFISNIMVNVTCKNKDMLQNKDRLSFQINMISCKWTILQWHINLEYMLA